MAGHHSAALPSPSGPGSYVFYGIFGHHGTILEPLSNPKQTVDTVRRHRRRPAERPRPDMRPDMGSMMPAPQTCGAWRVAELGRRTPLHSLALAGQSVLFWVEKGQKNNARWQRGQDLGYSACAERLIQVRSVRLTWPSNCTLIDMMAGILYSLLTIPSGMAWSRRQREVKQQKPSFWVMLTSWQHGRLETRRWSPRVGDQTGRCTVQLDSGSSNIDIKNSTERVRESSGPLGHHRHPYTGFLSYCPVQSLFG
jgi:hypothetical protein